MGATVYGSGEVKDDGSGRPALRLTVRDALGRLVVAYGVRRAVVLMGVALTVWAGGWDALAGGGGYRRQAVWKWGRDLRRVGVEPLLMVVEDVTNVTRAEGP